MALPLLLFVAVSVAQDSLVKNGDFEDDAVRLTSWAALPAEAWGLDSNVALQNYSGFLPQSGSNLARAFGSSLTLSQELSPQRGATYVLTYYAYCRGNPSLQAACFTLVDWVGVEFNATEPQAFQDNDAPKGGWPQYQHEFLVPADGRANATIVFHPPNLQTWRVDNISLVLTSPGPAGSAHHSHSQAGAIAGGVVGGVALTAIVLTLIGFFVRRSRRRRSGVPNGVGTSSPRPLTSEMEEKEPMSSSEGGSKVHVGPPRRGILLASSQSGGTSTSRSGPSSTGSGVPSSTFGQPSFSSPSSGVEDLPFTPDSHRSAYGGLPEPHTPTTRSAGVGEGEGPTSPGSWREDAERPDEYPAYGPPPEKR